MEDEEDSTAELAFATYICAWRSQVKKPVLNAA